MSFLPILQLDLKLSELPWTQDRPDTWFLADNAHCTSAQTLQPVPIDQCGYSGPKYVPNGTFERIPDIHFNGTYGTGETINGPLGYTELDFGGINIPKQIVSAATYASVGGVPEGNVSGIIGLSYAANTNAFPGTDPSMDVLCTNNTDSGSCGPQNYSPFITTIFNDNLTRSTFAFGLSRSQTSGGVMTLGGIPNLHAPDINATNGVVAIVPIELYANLTVFGWYVIGVDAFDFVNAAPNAGQRQFIVDTGTAINVLPEAEAATVNALFDPPAVSDDTPGLYVVWCNASAPS